MMAYDDHQSAAYWRMRRLAQSVPVAKKLAGPTDCGSPCAL